MVEPVLVGLATWLGNTLFGGLAYDKAKNIFGKDTFEELTQKALDKIIKKEENLIIWNEIMELKDLKIDDPTEFDYTTVCELLSEEYTEMCCNFFEDLEKEYQTQLDILAQKDPVTKFLLKKVRHFDERITSLEQKPGRSTEFKKYYIHLTERVKNVKKIIKTRIVDVSDFVGRRGIIDTLPEGDIFIQGNAAYGKTYVMIKLCNKLNGYYIPLDVVKETEVLEILLTEAREQGKRIFLDDFHCAPAEIQEYIQAYVVNMVVASRREPTITRDFTVYTLDLLDTPDIKEYFVYYGIDIDKDILDMLKNDLDFPIKLRIFVDYLGSKGYVNLDEPILKEIVKDLGLEKFKLPDELNKFYKKFVFNRFNKEQIQLCYVLSLLRGPGSVGQLSQITEIPGGEVSKLLSNMQGVLKVYEDRYIIFHDSFAEFCRKGLGDARRLHKKIGMYFEGLENIEGIVEAMYHYRVSGEKDGFKRVYDLSVVQSLIDVGGWDEARKDLEVGVEVREGKEKADSIMVLGTIYYRKGEWDKAMGLYRESQKIFKKLGDIHGLAQTYGNLGLVYADKGEWDTAIEYYEKDLEISEKLGDIHGLAQTYGNLGLVYADKGEWDTAIEYYEKDLKISEKLGDIHGLAQTYNNLGLVYAKKGEWDTAIEYYEKSVEISEKLGDIHGLAQTYNNLGSVYYRKGEWDTAIEYYEKDLEISEKLGDIHGLAQTYGNLGLVYADKGEWDTAIEYYEKDLKIFKKLGDRHGLAQTYNNLGLVYAKKGEWDTAIEYYEKSVEIKEKLGDIHGLAQTYNNLGSVYYRKGEWDTAIEYYEKSVEISEKLGDIHGLAQTYGNLGLVYADKGEWDTAIEYYEKDLEISEKLGDRHGLAQTYNNLGLVYADKGEWDTAIEYYEKSVEIKEKLGDIHGLAQTYGNLGLVYADKGEWDTAIEYYEKDLEIKEKLGDIHGLALTKYGIANILRNKKKFKKALDLYFESEKIFKKLGDKLNLMKVYYNLLLCYKDMNQEEKAIEYYQKAETLRKNLGIEFE
jgi:tetratricopeptide (TPR) repeat protein